MTMQDSKFIKERGFNMAESNMNNMNNTWNMPQPQNKNTVYAPQMGGNVTMGNMGNAVNTGNMANLTQVRKRPDTEETKRMRNGFGFFGPVTFAYAVLYAFCMFHNGAGITFPFFIAGSLLYLCFSLNKLGISLKKGSVFYMVSMMLLSVSTFCTDDARIIAFNKTGIFLLMMSLLLKQFFDTSGWELGKYLLAICQLVFGCFGEIGKPFSDMAAYFKSSESRHSKKIWYGALGVVIAIPIFLIVLLLLSSADAVFRDMTNHVLKNVNFGNICNIIFRIVFIYFASYMLTSFLCKRIIREDVKDKRKGEPIIAITITGMLSFLYLIFSGVQIIYLFLGKMQLPAGYTYAEYAREGFFQLLAVSILNLIIVLLAMSFFRESKVLKVILTIMSLCTFIMIASSAMRMIIYIQYYYLTFLRILVLWALTVLFLLFLGIVANIVKVRFPLFTYSMVVVTVLYLVLSFMHPDYIIAAVNVANAAGNESAWEKSEFFKSSEPYHDYSYLCMLSADAAPVLIPYMAELGYDMDDFVEAVNDKECNLFGLANEKYDSTVVRSRSNTFGYYYVDNLQGKMTSLSLRTFNVSRYMALRQIERYESLSFNDTIEYEWNRH